MQKSGKQNGPARQPYSVGDRPTVIPICAVSTSQDATVVQLKHGVPMPKLLGRPMQVTFIVPILNLRVSVTVPIGVALSEHKKQIVDDHLVNDIAL